MTKKRLCTLLISLAAVCFAAALFLLVGGLPAWAEIYRATNADNSLTFERLSADDKVLKNAYIERYGVPTSEFDYTNNGGEEAGASITYAFDRNFSSIWRSSMQWKNGDNATINEVTVTFHAPTKLDRILYQADASWGNRGSFTKARISYIKAETSDGDTMPESRAFVAFPDLEVERTSETNANLISFAEMTVWSIKIEWLAVHTGHRTCAAASEIIFLQPESNDVEKVQGLFKDYNQLTLQDDITSEDQIEALRKNVMSYASYKTELSYLLNRAEQVLAGTVKYDARREMGTDPKSENVLTRYGNVAGYARSTLKMAWFGTNRQATGVSVAPGEELIVYVDGAPGDPLPTLTVTQFWGAWSSWRSGEYKLSLGKNIIRPGSYLQPNFTTDKGAALPAGGPVYLNNPYISEQLAREEERTEQIQSDRVKVYFEGGTLIPIFRKGGDVGLYKQRVAEYAAAVQKDREETDLNNDYGSMLPHRDYKVVDVTEIVSDNINITVRATAADNYYNNLQYDPQKACENWDNYVKELLRSDGVILEKTDPNLENYRGKYDPRAKWLNCNIRLMQPYGAAYAHVEHVGIQVSWEGGALTGENFGWGYTHELGHMMDIGERTVSECSNNMLSKYDETVMSKIATRGDFAKTTAALAPDVREEPSFWNTNRGNFIFWWLIESYEPGWWPRLENLYRYYDIYARHRDAKGALEPGFDAVNATEKQVLLASISMGYDLSYYFERWGYNLSSNDPVFSVETASASFKTLMAEAKAHENVKEGTMPKIWYLDAAEWWARHNDKEEEGPSTTVYNGTGNARIEAVTKGSAGYSLLLRSDKMDDPSHLGFEIREGTGENAKVIAFTTDSVFLDTKQYGNKLPVYSVVAYDRALTCSGKSKEVALEELAPVCRIEKTEYTSLYDAYMAAKSGDTIVLLDSCYMGGLTVGTGKTLTIATENKACTLFRGGAGVMFTVEADAKLILRGTSSAPLTIDGLGYEQDSALVRTLGNLEISHCVLRDNHIRMNAKKGGGAIDIATGGDADIRISDTRFENNSSYYGGAVYFAGGVGSVISGCTFKGNRAVEGGAVYINNVRSVTIESSRFEHNIADMGGMNNVTPVGGAIAAVNWYANIVANDLTFIGNAAARGGALYFDSQSFNGNRILMKDNVATEEGGAVYLARKGWTNNMNWNNLTLKETTVKGTVCEEGSALYLRSNSTLGLTLGENRCKYAICFAEGSFNLPGGEWQGGVFLAKIAHLTADGAFPVVPAGKSVRVETDLEEVGGTFIAARGFQGKLGDEAGFTVEGGSIAFDSNSLMFALKTVEVTLIADGEQSTSRYIVGRTFRLPLAFEKATKYMLSWSDGTNTYEPGSECVAEKDVTFTAEVHNKTMVTLVYPREGLEKEISYYIPGETFSLPVLDAARQADFVKYDLKSWKDATGVEYMPYATITAEKDKNLTFTAELVDKLVVRYLIHPYTEGAAFVPFAAAEDHLIETYYYSYGELIRFVRWKDAPEEYVPVGGTIDGYLNAATGEEINFSNFFVTQSLDLYAVVNTEPIAVVYMYTANGGTEFSKDLDPFCDFVKPGSDYTISLSNVPFGYHFASLELYVGYDVHESFSSEEEIEAFRLTNVKDMVMIIADVMPNEYTVTYKYNGEEVAKTEVKKFGETLTLREPTDLPAGYTFNSYQLGRRTLVLNDEGEYVEQDTFVDIRFKEEEDEEPAEEVMPDPEEMPDPETGILMVAEEDLDEDKKIEIEITENIVINIVVSMDAGLTLQESELELDLDGGRTASLTAGVIDGERYTLRWESNNASVATVESGVVTAHAVGIAVITVSAYRGETFLSSQSCTVTVKASDTQLTLDPEEATLYLGEGMLTITCTAEEGSTLEWTTDAPAVATVSGGVVTAHGEGIATITVICRKAGVELARAVCQVTVRELAVTDIEVDLSGVKKTYAEDEKFDASGAVVRAVYNSGKAVTLNAGDYTVTADPDTMSKDTAHVTLTVTYLTFTKTEGVDVTVETKKVARIEIPTAPGKTEYTEGETFDPAGMVVTVYYGDGSSHVAETYDYDKHEPLTPSDTEVTVSYAGASAKVQITVKAKPAEPENPENPENPNNPDTPDNPNTPDNPDKPDNPDTPSDPSAGDNGLGLIVGIAVGAIAVIGLVVLLAVLFRRKH